MTVATSEQIPAPPAERLRAQLSELAAIHRPSASAGERQAAEWALARLREHGARGTDRHRAGARRLLGARSRC